MRGTKKYKLKVDGEERSVRISALWRGGKTQAEIGEMEGLTQARVSQLINKLRDEWRQRTAEHVDDKMAMEVANLYAQQQHTIDLFIRSCLPHISIKVPDKDGKRKLTAKEKAAIKKRLVQERNDVYERMKRMDLSDLILCPEAQMGDPNILRNVLDIIKYRCKLFDLEPKSSGEGTNVNITNVNAQQNTGKLPGWEELRKLPLDERLRLLRDTTVGQPK